MLISDPVLRNRFCFCPISASCFELSTESPPVSITLFNRRTCLPRNHMTKRSWLAIWGTETNSNFAWTYFISRTSPSMFRRCLSCPPCHLSTVKHRGARTIRAHSDHVGTSRLSLHVSATTIRQNTTDIKGAIRRRPYIRPLSWTGRSLTRPTCQGSPATRRSRCEFGLSASPVS